MFVLEFDAGLFRLSVNRPELEPLPQLPPYKPLPKISAYAL